MKKAIPGLECDDDDNTDDQAPSTDDDATPDDYWKCLKSYSDKDACTGGGCEWCTNKAGYGICLSKEAAEKVDHYDWFDCKAEINDPFVTNTEEDLVSVDDPYDPSCLQASLEGDETTCKATKDSEGNVCEWCNVASTNLCLTSEQAAMVEQFGGDCSAAAAADVIDPYDPSCLAASLSGDEATCASTVDADGNGCEWCNVNSVNLCLNTEQAEMVEQIGGQCSHAMESEDEEEADDPYDPSCLQASLQGDEASCEAATDADGNKCEWCAVSGVNLCLTSEQAQAAELVGGQCSSEGNAVVTDPYDTSCLQASLQGDESSCEAAVDQDGTACVWCAVAGVNVCLTEPQAEEAALVGGKCGSSETPSL